VTGRCFAGGGWIRLLEGAIHGGGWHGGGQTHGVEFGVTTVWGGGGGALARERRVCREGTEGVAARRGSQFRKVGAE